MPDVERWLLDQMEQLPVMDAHEHLLAESEQLAEPADALLFFRQYTRLVMFSAGLSEATFMRMHDPSAPLDERFAIFDSIRELIRASGPARAAHIALQHFYGASEVTRENYAAITEAMRVRRRPGMYDDLLRRDCGIRCVLQNSPAPDYDSPLLRAVPMIGVAGEWDDFPVLAGRIARGEHGFATLDDYLEERAARLRRLKARGAVAFKHTAHLYSEPQRGAAEEAFGRLRQGDLHWTRTDIPNPLLNYLTDRLLDVAGELGLPVALHAGVWGDFRTLDATQMIPYFMRHPDVRFDIFHMSLPAAREAGRIGANFGNVWLNMCWAHTIAPAQAANALDEWLDQVAANKIIAFGGDVRWCVEKVYGHLALARQVTAEVLARRIARRLLTPEHALWLARRWFYDNPAELYGLPRG